MPINKGVAINGDIKGYFVPFKDQTHWYIDWSNAVSIGTNQYTAQTKGFLHCAGGYGTFTLNSNSIDFSSSSNYFTSFPIKSGDIVKFSNIMDDYSYVYFIPYAE